MLTRIDSFPGILEYVDIESFDTFDIKIVSDDLHTFTRLHIEWGDCFVHYENGKYLVAFLDDSRGPGGYPATTMMKSHSNKISPELKEKFIDNSRKHPLLDHFLKDSYRGY